MTASESDRDYVKSDMLIPELFTNLMKTTAM